MKKLCQIVLIISAIFMFSLLLSGCAKNDNTILAKIGSDKITAKDLNDLFGRSGINFRSFDEEYQNRKMILDSLIIQQLLIQEAYKKHLDTSEEINGIILASNNKFLLDILYQREIIDKIKVTDAEIKAFYDKLENKVQASHILLTTADTAKIVMDSLKKGANFEDMAVRYSIDPSAKINRGDLGYFTWGRLDPTFQEQAFKLNPGEMSEPFKTRFGWHIVKMSNRAPNELRQSYDKMIPTIRTNIENMKRMELLETFKTTVKDKYPVAAAS
ncbi:MAG: peptidylprolyl isomerase [candidate division Zixibacteria bacterium]|nr:peptidylprolyl isomerase [candidate division Zixibacteria bacterium]